MVPCFSVRYSIRKFLRREYVFDLIMSFSIFILENFNELLPYFTRLSRKEGNVFTYFICDQTIKFKQFLLSTIYNEIF